MRPALHRHNSSLIPLTPQDCLGIYPPPLPRGRLPSHSSRQQLFLFVLGNTEEGRSAELRTGVMEPLLWFVWLHAVREGYRDRRRVLHLGQEGA
jgi:hypothetical protein